LSVDDYRLNGTRAERFRVRRPGRWTAVHYCRLYKARRVPDHLGQAGPLEGEVLSITGKTLEQAKAEEGYLV
jgi:hypothetical protein